MNKARRILFTFVLLVVLGPYATGARADTLFGITFSNQLITINPNTGAGTLVGNLDSSMFGYGLAVRGGNLYTYDQTADLIRQIDPNTGHTLASINIGAGNLVGEGDLAFRSDGVGFLTTGGPSLSLRRFDLSPPNSSIVGPLPGPFFNGLAFNSSDVLYGISKGFASFPSRLYTINQTTAVETLVGGLNVAAAVSEDLGGLTFRSDGTLWAALSDQTTSTLVRVNAATGQATNVGIITGFGNVSGIAFLNTTVTTPEPSTFLLTATGLIGLVGFGGRRMKSRR
jgi:hypothetical protein